MTNRTVITNDCNQPYFTQPLTRPSPLIHSISASSSSIAKFTSMAADTTKPQVLFLGPALFSSKLQTEYSQEFHFLQPSSLPLPQFFAADRIQPSSIRALICEGGYLVNGNVLRLLPSLGLVMTTSVGLDHIDLQECRRRGVQVASAGSLFSEDVADMAVGLLIDVMRKISAADRFVRRQEWPESLDFPLCSKVGGKRVGIVGFGSIGMEVAKRLEAFGCIILYHSRKPKPFVSYPFYSSVIVLAAKSDALVICCPLNEQTKHIISKQVMLALGKGGVIVNVGRGALVDEKELVGCLMEGEIGGAGLDVFEDEPRVPKELFGLDNVVLSPHAAASTSDSYNGMVELVGRNLEAFFSNKPLITPVILD